MTNIAALQKGIRIVAATSADLVKALIGRRREIKAIVEERRPPHAQGKLIEVADGIWSKTTIDTIERLDAIGIQLNALWAQLPPSWKCPCCNQTKENLICFPEGNKNPEREKIAIAQAVEHHDHFISYVAHTFRRELGSNWSRSSPIAGEVQRRLGAGTIAFDSSVICELCNLAEGKAKKVLSDRLKIDKNFLDYFSFAPDEIRRFIRPSSNAHHQLDEDIVVSVFNDGRKHEIMAFRKDAVDVQVRLVREGLHWRSPEAPGPDALVIQEVCEDALLEFGMETGANFSFCELSATDQNRKVDPFAWINAKPKPLGHVGDRAAEAFFGETSTVREVGLAWRCACCARSPRAAVRYNNTRKLTFQTRIVRPDGEEVVICIDCHIAMCSISGAAEADRDDVKLDDIREVFGFGSNQRHRIRSASIAHFVIERVRERAVASRIAQVAAEENAYIVLKAEQQMGARIVRHSTPYRAKDSGLY